MVNLFPEFEDDNITSYVNNTTPYSCAGDISSVNFELEKTAKKCFDWCKNKHMKDNFEKCHAILSSNTQKVIHFGNTSIASSLGEKLFGITWDS